MPKVVTVTCDVCGSDLTTTGNSVDYRTVLRSEAIPPSVGAVTDLMDYPQFDEPIYFCDAHCFWEWVAAGLKARG